MGIPAFTIQPKYLEGLSDLATATLLVPVSQLPSPSKSDATGAEDDENQSSRLAMTGWAAQVASLLSLDLAQLAHEEKFDASRGKALVARTSDQQSLKRVIFYGLGEPSKLSRLKLTDVFEAAFKQVTARDVSLHATTLLLPEGFEVMGGPLANDTEHSESIDAGTLALAVVDGLANTLYLSKESKKKPKQLPTVQVGVSSPQALSQVEAALPLAHALVAGRALAKDLINQPANTKTTQTLVEAAQALKAQFPFLSLAVEDNAAEIAKAYPCFYAVAQGSVATDPPKFIHLQYKGANPTQKLAFVGKSVIFDTGGYQVKPGNSMVTMKGDMAGGASVLGALQVVAQLQPEHLQLDVYLAATPNKIDSDAMIPDSIVNTRCGKTVEIRHTDAEGRLTLIDAVAKAAEAQPDVIVTVATLTGAAMRAVGRSIALMGNHPRWEQKVLSAAQTAGDPVQPLAVTPEDFEDIKSKIDGADLRNTSKNENRGAQSAAAFVMSGAPEGTPCVHLDIAGADMTADETATAYSVRTLAHLALMLG